MAKQQILKSLAKYQIKLKERLGNQWAERFEGKIIASEGCITTIADEVSDQTVLHGLLNRGREPPWLIADFYNMGRI